MEQIEQLRKLLGDPATFGTVFQPYAAKTKLKNSEIRKFVIEAVRKCLKASPKSQSLLLSILRGLYEAQDKELCESVANKLGTELDLQGIELNRADCLYVGYFLTHCKGFQVDLRRCSIDGDGCRALFKTADNCKYDLLTLK